MDIKNHTGKFFNNNELLTIFLRDVRSYKVLTSEEQEELIKQYREGDKSAKDKLINSNLRFIYSLAKIYAKNEDEVLDYVNEGVIGLSSAIESYNMIGYKFMSYAVWYIRRAMNFYLSDTKNLINKSNVSKIGKKVNIFRQKFVTENGYEPSNDDIKENLWKEYNILIKDDRDLYDMTISSISDEIDDGYTVEDSDEFSEKTSSNNIYEDTIEDDFNKQILDDMFNGIPKKYKSQVEMVKMLYGVGYDREYSPFEVANKFKIRPENLYEIKDRIFKLMNSNYQIKKAL